MTAAAVLLGVALLLGSFCGGAYAVQNVATGNTMRCYNATGNCASVIEDVPNSGCNNLQPSAQVVCSTQVREAAGLT